ncbi:MAG: hypothetical protein AAF772_06205 [Acidobacteriota bacterium]
MRYADNCWDISRFERLIWNVIALTVCAAAAIPAQAAVPITTLRVEVDAATPIPGVPQLRGATLTAREHPIDHELRVRVCNTADRTLADLHFGVAVRDARDRLRSTDTLRVPFTQPLAAGETAWARRPISLSALRATRGDRVVVHTFDGLHETLDPTPAHRMERDDGLQLVVPQTADPRGLAIDRAELDRIDVPLDYDVALTWEGLLAVPASTQLLEYDVFDQDGAPRGGGSYAVDLPAHHPGIAQTTTVSLPLGALGLQRGDTIRLRLRDLPQRAP